MDIVVAVVVSYRLKDIAQEQYTMEEAERGAGRTKEILPSAAAARADFDEL